MFCSNNYIVLTCVPTVHVRLSVAITNCCFIASNPGESHVTSPVAKQPDHVTSPLIS